MTQSNKTNLYNMMNDGFKMAMYLIANGDNLQDDNDAVSNNEFNLSTRPSFEGADIDHKDTILDLEFLHSMDDDELETFYAKMTLWLIL